MSDKQRTEEECVEVLMKRLYGQPEVEIESDAHPYSEVTPSLCWSHRNKFLIGGHDMNRELLSHVGKWVLIRLTLNHNGALCDGEQENIEMKTDSNRAVACIRFVRLAGRLAGQYCQFTTGERVKVSTTGNGLATVERAEWRNSLTICNVLYGVPEHLVCEITEDEPSEAADSGRPNLK